MSIIDKKEIISSLNNRIEPLKIDIGCGPLKKHEDYIGIDALDFEGVDIVGDIFEVVKKIPDNSVDEIYSSHFFEHIENLELLIEELSRILKPNGALIIIVPHFSNPYYYSDYTHKKFFGLYSFSYLAKENLFYRKVPQYQKIPILTITNVHMNFKSPFFIRDKIFKLLGTFINLNYYFKETYEELFTGCLHCYELQFTLRKLQ